MNPTSTLTHDAHGLVSRGTAASNQQTEINSLVGIGLRSPHHQVIEQRLQHQALNSIGWLEIHSENYLLPDTSLSNSLSRIAKDIPISCHGVGLSLGSIEEPSTHHLDQLSRLEKRLKPMFISDHLSWSQSGGTHYNDLLPLPYTEEALTVFARNVDIVQDRLGRPLLIENPSSYLRFAHSTIAEWDFLNEVQARTQCRLLLDLNNIHVSAFNHGFNADQYLKAINHNAVDEIHLAGFTKKQLPQGEIWIDTHSKPVSTEVWTLYQGWLKTYGPRATLIEWDTDLPEVDTLLEEANKATSKLQHYYAELNAEPQLLV